PRGRARARAARGDGEGREPVRDADLRDAREAARRAGHRSGVDAAAAGMSARAAVIAARGSFALIAAWIALAALLRATGPALAAAAVPLPFPLLGHRLPERTLAIFGAPMPLCSRCLGLWGGLSLGGALAWPALPLRALRIVVPAALALLLAEVVTQDLGVHP